MKVNKTNLKRTIAAVTSAIFVFTQFGIITPSFSALPDEVSLPKADQITIPEAYGKIVETFNGDSDKLVVHIQDLHTNPEAQRNLSQIIDYFIDNYGVKLLGVEGAAKGRVDPEWLANISMIKAINDKMADIFLNSGELTGEEYLYITKYPKLKDVTFWGIEDKEPYWKNREVFNRTYPKIRENMRLCSSLEGGLEKIKKQVYPEVLNELDEKRAAYEKRELEVKDYTSYLVGLANQKDIDLAQYENFSILAKLVAIQDKLEFSKVDKERTLLFDALSKVLSEEQSKELTEKVKGQNEGKLTAIEFYSYLKDLAENNGLNFSEYPSIGTYMEYITTSDTLDNVKLFKELDQVEEAIVDSYITTDEQRQLARFSKMLGIMKKFFDINLSNEDLDFYQKNKDEFKAQGFIDFIKDKTRAYNIRYSLDPSLSQLDKALLEQDEFYKVVIVRDEAMVRNTLQKMDEGNFKMCVQFCGGFHTKGMMKLYKEQGISYLVVSPHVTKDFDEENYRNLLQEKRKPIDELMSEFSSLLRPAPASAKPEDGGMDQKRAVGLAVTLSRDMFTTAMSDEDAAIAAIRTINPNLVRLAGTIQGFEGAVNALRNEVPEVTFDGLTQAEKDFYTGLGIDLSDAVFVTGFGVAPLGLYDPANNKRIIHRWWGLAGILYNKTNEPRLALGVSSAITHVIDTHERLHKENPEASEEAVLGMEFDVLEAKSAGERQAISFGLDVLAAPIGTARGRGEILGREYAEFVRSTTIKDLSVQEGSLEMPPKEELIAKAAAVSRHIVEATESERQEAITKATSVVQEHDNYFKAQAQVPSRLIKGNLLVDIGALFTADGRVLSINPPGTLLGYGKEDLKAAGVNIVRVFNIYGLTAGQIERFIQEQLGLSAEDGITIQVLSPEQVVANKQELINDNMVYLRRNEGSLSEVLAVNLGRRVVIELAEGQEDTVYLSPFAIAIGLAGNATDVWNAIEPPEVRNFVSLGEAEVRVAPVPNNFVQQALIEALKAIQR
ncbi:MAG: hypothetical protein V1893_02890 [Candidatus Omnitrophota bacterium]